MFLIGKGEYCFLPFVINIRFTDRILQNPIDIKGSFDDFRNNQNRNPKAGKFFEYENGLAYHAKKQITTEKSFIKLKAAI
jgi:hypothetical protein